MKLVDAETYEAVTGDTAGATYEADEAAVVAAFEQLLDRGLVAVERVEVCDVWDGTAFPSALPLVSVDAVEVRVGGDWEDAGVGGYDDLSVQVPARDGARARVTYTGGFTPAGSDDDPECPADLAQAIAWAVHTVRHPVAPSMPDDVASLNVAGELSMTRIAHTRTAADGDVLPEDCDLRWLPYGARAARLASPYGRRGLA